MKFLFKTILIFFSIQYGIVYSQSVVQLFVEDFNQPTVSWSLNDSVSGPNVGTINWIINNQYDGFGLVPNTPDQTNTFGGTISNAPFSGYAHIHDSTIVKTASNSNYNGTISSDTYLVMSDGICTKGLNNVELSFFYIGEGNTNAYAEVYYSTGSSGWTKVGATKYNNKSQWKYEQITDLNFDDAYDLKFAFRLDLMYLGIQ